MSRNVAAAELQSAIEHLDALAARAERLAAASGRIVDPKWFRAVRASMSMAAGDLDSKGLLTERTEETSA